MVDQIVRLQAWGVTLPAIAFHRNFRFQVRSNGNCKSVFSFEMAEFEEIGEMLEGCTEGIEGEAAAAEGELAEEIATEAKEASENVALLKRGVEALQKINVPIAVRSFTEFILKNAAMAGIFYGVNVVLTKLFGKASDHGEKQAIQGKKIKVTAVAQLLSQIAKASNKLAEWSKAKENVSVDVEDITVPLPDVLSKFTQPMGKVSALISSKWKPLVQKSVISYIYFTFIC